ncbi:MAG: metallophosphoesterase family protein [Candidatus Omnitrophota bacterium]
MKIGVISDTHIPMACDYLPESVGEAFKDVDMILHAGDIVTMKVIDQLKQINSNIEVVSGNMDAPDVQARFPDKKIITAGKFKIGLIHGWGDPATLPERVLDEFKKVDIIVFGHSHIPYNKEKKGVLLFNPGSPTDMIHAPYNSVGILELANSKKGTIIRI